MLDLSFLQDANKKLWEHLTKAETTNQNVECG